MFPRCTRTKLALLTKSGQGTLHTNYTSSKTIQASRLLAARHSMLEKPWTCPNGRHPLTPQKHTRLIHQGGNNEVEASSTPKVYTVPTNGLLARIPKSLVPLAELSRLEKPAGTAYLLMPCVFSTLLASSVTASSTDLITLCNTILLFTAGATIMRGAGCTLNDLYDRNFDKSVERTRFRPLARGAITVPGALTWAGFQCLLGFGVLIQFSPNTILMALPSMFLVCTYPLAKRVTHYPQFVLGCAFSWGALLGFPALGAPMIDFGLVLPSSSQMSVASLTSAFENMSLSLGDTNVIASAGLLYASCVVWTLLYDTIYAFQDIRDDRKVGIKSTAQAFSSKGLAANMIDNKPKMVLSALAVVQTALLTGSGFILGLGPAFYGLSCGGAAMTLAVMIQRVKLNDVISCAWWFKMCCWITGGAISSGLLIEYAIAVSTPIA